MFFKKALTDLQKGNRYLVQQEYERAIECFLRHAEKCPQEQATAYVQVAECYLRSNIIAQPVQAAPGIALVSAGDLPSAERYFRRALQADPNHFGALRGLANVLPDDADERLSVLERAASRHPDCLILLALGDFYRTHRKEFGPAYEAYRRAQEHHPHDETAYRRLSDICRRLGRDDEAAEWSERWRQDRATKR